jgi:DNA-binding transcriptional MerR regulator
MPSSRYTLAALSRIADVTPRTVRYYIGQGLLPGPDVLGPAAHYDERHLGRLRLIKRLQLEHLPLAEIRARLAELDDDQIALLADEATPESPAVARGDAGASALAYIRDVLGDRSRRPSEGGASMGPPTGLSRPGRASSPAPRPMRLALSDFRAETSDLVAEHWAKPAPKPRPPGSERSTWERIRLAPDVEIHVRRPLDRHTNKRLERLLDAARDLFKEDPR